MSIPIIIIAYNRLSCLRDLLNRLDFYENVIIVDNNSSYEPLLDFYSNLNREIKFLDSNIGHFSPWAAEIVPINSHYIVTDCDVIPDKGCPNDFVDFLLEICSSDPSLLKVGLSLRIDNIPEHYSLKSQVIDHESQFWSNKLHPKNGVELYNSPIDTTFALYAPNSAPGLVPSVRTGNPYTAIHTPWYTNSSELEDEEIYYRNSMNKNINNWNKN